MCQSRRTALAKHPSCQTSQKTLAAKTGEAALAHANRGRPSPRRLPAQRTPRHPPAGPHHLCRLQRSSSLRKTRRDRRLLTRPRDSPPPACARAVSARPATPRPTHRQRRLRAARIGEMVHLDGSPIAGCKIAVHNSPPWASKTTPHQESRGRTVLSHRRRPWLSFSASSALASSRYPARLLWRQQRHLCPQRRVLDCRGTARRQASTYSVRTRSRSNSGSPILRLKSPQAKGRIERFGALFRIASPANSASPAPTDLPSANLILQPFIPDYNRRFARAPRETEIAWRPAPKDLDRICCFIHERVVSNDNVVQWDGRRFQIPPQPKRFSFAGAKVQLYQSLEGASTSTTVTPICNTPSLRG